MEAKKLEATLRVDAEGRLQGDAELLARMTNQTFTVQVVGRTFTLEPKRIHEIEDPHERREALDTLLERVAIADVPPPPDDHNLRDDIYP